MAEAMFQPERDVLAFSRLVRSRSDQRGILPAPDSGGPLDDTGITDLLRGLPGDARQTVTFDRGSECAAYAALDRDVAVTSYFYDPHSPWRKGSVEDTNGRIRRFLTRHREPEALAQARRRRLADRLNGTPRRLGYRTPREVFGQ